MPCDWKSGTTNSHKITDYCKLLFSGKTFPLRFLQIQKKHYDLLDGLRGVAALFVIWYHVFEGFAFAGGGSIDTLNHGYLAVDFFFMLSGYGSMGVGWTLFLSGYANSSVKSHILGCIIFAYIALKLYNEPLRRYLAKRFLH